MEPSAESGTVGGPRDPLADITKDPRETLLRCKWVLGEVLVCVLQREERNEVWRPSARELLAF